MFLKTNNSIRAYNMNGSSKMGRQNAADCSWMGSCWADKREDRDGETDGDPMGARAVETTERGSERVEAGADGGGRMRRILVELETRLVFQERVQGGGGGKRLQD